ncbi:MAG TPA: hypothetical protein VN253_05100 [Kofleriaceae bacterium]|nr:hypothetical protein [Kofleriaceae bacterium]
MSNEDSRMMWWRVAPVVRVARALRFSQVALVARFALYGALLCGAPALLAAGCTTQLNPRSCADGFCNDPAFPFCDVDGTIAGGQRLTCIPVACTPLEFAACRGDEDIVCNATGDDYDVTHCEGGCDAASRGCKATHIIPRYLPTVCDQLAAAPELTISESMTLDTESDGICNGGLVEQRSEDVNIGPAICVLRYGTIRIATNKTLTVTGRHALALVADQALIIDGVLDVSANGIKNGPGYASSSQGITHDPFCPNAQGGAGFKTIGGPGGSASVDGGAVNGGAAHTDPALIEALIAGSRIVDYGFPFSVPGGNGGAATLISCRDVVSVVGLIDAGGGGGPGGSGPSGTCISPGGGGSGGYVALQGMNVSVTGQVFANGGGGGAGSHIVNVNSNQGADGTRSDTMSAQGGISLNGEGAGGAGGRVGADPGSGRKPIVAGYGAGAGGGSTGFFQAYTPAGVTPMLMPAAASPAFQPNRTIPAR